MSLVAEEYEGFVLLLNMYDDDNEQQLLITDKSDSFSLLVTMYNNEPILPIIENRNEFELLVTMYDN